MLVCLLLQRQQYGHQEDVGNARTQRVTRNVLPAVKYDIANLTRCRVKTLFVRATGKCGSKKAANKHKHAEITRCRMEEQRGSGCNAVSTHKTLSADAAVNPTNAMIKLFTAEEHGNKDNCKLWN